MKLNECICIYLCVIYMNTLVSASSEGEQLKAENPDLNNESNFPRFAEPIPNITVTVGGNALLACAVDNLRGYKVAWVREDTEIILSIHLHVITRNPRIAVTHKDYHSWYLHIRDVKESDRGWYVCKVNADPFLSQKGYIQVVLLTVIDESMTSNDMVVREETNVTLTR